MSKRYTVSSGDYTLVTKQTSPKKAASLAIRLHIESKHHTELGILTMVESDESKPFFFSTESLISN